MSRSGKVLSPRPPAAGWLTPDAWRERAAGSEASQVTETEEYGGGGQESGGEGRQRERAPAAPPGVPCHWGVPRAGRRRAVGLTHGTKEMTCRWSGQGWTTEAGHGAAPTCSLPRARCKSSQRPSRSPARLTLAAVRCSSARHRPSCRKPRRESPSRSGQGTGVAPRGRQRPAGRSARMRTRQPGLCSGSSSLFSAAAAFGDESGPGNEDKKATAAVAVMATHGVEDDGGGDGQRGKQEVANGGRRETSSRRGGAARKTTGQLVAVRSPDQRTPSRSWSSRTESHPGSCTSCLRSRTMARPNAPSQPQSRLRSRPLNNPSRCSAR